MRGNRCRRGCRLSLDHVREIERKQRQIENDIFTRGGEVKPIVVVWISSVRKLSGLHIGVTEHVGTHPLLL